MICNVVRVVVTGLLHIHGREDLAQGTPHQLLGLLMIFVAFGMYYLVSQLLAGLIIESPESENQS